MSNQLPSSNAQMDFNEWSMYGYEQPQIYNQKCECGTERTYPKDDTTYMHSDYCPKYKAKPTQEPT